MIDAGLYVDKNSVADGLEGVLEMTASLAFFRAVFHHFFSMRSQEIALCSMLSGGGRYNLEGCF